MKRYLKHFELTEELVRQSIYNCLDHNRWKRRDTSYMIAEYYIQRMHPDKDLREIAHIIRNIAYRDKTKLYPIIDYIASEIYKEIKDRDIRLKPINYQIRKDFSNGKLREIGVSSMKQQLFDYIAVDCCYQMFMAKIGTYQCASIKGRGQIYGKNAIEKWFHTNPKKCKWIIQCDVKKYYPSIDRDILKKYLRRDIANDDVLYVLYTLMDSYKEGLCIGSYLSQFLANYLLSYAYHYLDEWCFKERRGKRKNLIYKKLFYMDDIFMCGSDQRDVKMAFNMLRKYLKSEMNLDIKDGYKFHDIDSYPTDIVGFKIGAKYTTVRKRVFERADKYYLKFKNPAVEMNEKEARSCISYYGHFKNSDSKTYIKKNKVDQTIDRAKEVIRNENNRKCIGFDA